MSQRPARCSARIVSRVFDTFVLLNALVVKPSLPSSPTVVRFLSTVSVFIFGFRVGFHFFSAVVFRMRDSSEAFAPYPADYVRVCRSLFLFLFGFTREGVQDDGDRNDGCWPSFSGVVVQTLLLFCTKLTVNATHAHVPHSQIVVYFYLSPPLRSWTCRHARPMVYRRRHAFLHDNPLPPPPPSRQ